jgi:hypothetical protein
MGCGTRASAVVDDEGGEDGPCADGGDGDRDPDVDAVDPLMGTVDGNIMTEKGVICDEEVPIAAAGVGDRGIEGEDGVRDESLFVGGTRRAEIVGGGGTSAPAVLRSSLHGLYAQLFGEVGDGLDQNEKTPSSK